MIGGEGSLACSVKARGAEDAGKAALRFSSEWQRSSSDLLRLGAAKGVRSDEWALRRYREWGGPSSPPTNTRPRPGRGAATERCSSHGSLSS